MGREKEEGIAGKAARYELMNNMTKKKKKRHSVDTIAIRIDSLFKESDWRHVVSEILQSPSKI